MFKWMNHLLAEHGHLNALQWAQQNGLFIKGDRGLRMLHAAGTSSAKAAALQWLSRRLQQSWCDEGEETCSNAAPGGHLSTLQWVR